jgi:hypothetical protein
MPLFNIWGVPKFCLWAPHFILFLKLIFSQIIEIENRHINETNSNI